ncbi:hypothetical protein Z043_105515, partial [Scleropages formosus]
RALQVTPKRLHEDVTWASRSNVLGSSRVSCGYSNERAALSSPSVRGETTSHGGCNGNTWGSAPFVAALGLGSLAAGGRQKPWDAPLSASGAVRRHRFQPEPKLTLTLLHTGPGRSAWLGSAGAAGPAVFLWPEAGRCALWCPATRLATRASELSAGKRAQSTNAVPSKSPQEPENGKPNKRQQLKKVFKEYGAVGVMFHISISLMSLGMCYAAISSGIDMTALLFKVGFSETVVQSKMAAGTSTFVLAYAVHKLFAPVRISITLVSVPLLVRYFRKTGFFKPPASTP